MNELKRRNLVRKVGKLAKDVHFEMTNRNVSKNTAR